MGERLTNLEILKSVCLQLGDTTARSAFWKESLTLSLSSLSQNMIRFERAACAQDNKEIAAAAHKILGTISFLGVTELSKKLAHIQEAVDADTLKWPIPHLKEIQDQLLLIKNEIALEQNNPPT